VPCLLKHMLLMSIKRTTIYKWNWIKLQYRSVPKKNIVNEWHVFISICPPICLQKLFSFLAKYVRCLVACSLFVWRDVGSEMLCKFILRVVFMVSCIVIVL
jgi:hypothetical protein